VIRIETGLDSNSKEKGKKGKRSAKREIRMRKVHFEDER